jgi:small conductance mechanosensitive channel
MRFISLAVLVLALALGGPALGQSALLTHEKPGVGVTLAKPAIIPGSPLAVLTAAAKQPVAVDTDANAPAPFGTTGIGLSISSAIGAEASRTFGEFAGAVQQSTRLTPVVDWLGSFAYAPVRRAHLVDIVEALLLTMVPGLAVEAAVRRLLLRPRAGLIQRAAPLAVVEADEEAHGLEDAEAGGTELLPRRRVSLRAWVRRCGFGVLHLGLALLPLAGFALMIQQIVADGEVTTRAANLAVIGVANGYLFCRLVLEALRFLVAPGAAALRVISMSSRHARILVAQVRVLLGTGYLGYVAVSVGEILGLPQDGAGVLVRLISLVIHIEVAFAVWRSRRVVGGWIAGDPQAEGVYAGLRHRLGAVWHYFALFYIVALWIAWAGGVQNAFLVLLRVVVVLVVAMVVGRLAWVGSAVLLERVFPDPATVTARHPMLYARAHAYNPLLRVLVRVGIAGVVVVFVLQGWGVDALDWLMSNAVSRSLIGAAGSVAVTLGVALVLWETANVLLNGRVERLSQAGRVRQASRLRTLLPMFRAGFGAAIFLVAGLIALGQIGVNTTPLLAISGVLGIAVGFGSQKLVQDIITGLFLLFEDAMQVGDFVSLAGMSGTVEQLSIRTIRLRGADGSVNIIPFSAVTTVTNMTRDFGYAQISINVGYGEDIDRVSAVLTDIAAKMHAETAWATVMRGDLKLFGLDAFTPDALVVTGQIRTAPGQHWAVRREFYRRVLKRFGEEGISIPYNNQVFTIEPGLLSGQHPPEPAAPPRAGEPG